MVVTRRIIKLLLFVGLCWCLLAPLAARALIVTADLPHADAIVVLSGSSTYIERTHTAADLFKQGRAPLVVLTDDNTRGGWSSAQQRNPYFVERAHDELVKQGVPPPQIRVAPGVADGTHEEAAIVRDYVTANGLRSVLVVTSAYHSRRALRTLRQALGGTGVTLGMTTAPPGWQTPGSEWWWLHFEGWRTVGGEYVKLIYYWLRYG